MYEYCKVRIQGAGPRTQESVRSSPGPSSGKGPTRTPCGIVVCARRAPTAEIYQAVLQHLSRRGTSGPPESIFHDFHAARSSTPPLDRQVAFDRNYDRLFSRILRLSSPRIAASAAPPPTRTGYLERLRETSRGGRLHYDDYTCRTLTDLYEGGQDLDD